MAVKTIVTDGGIVEKRATSSGFNVNVPTNIFGSLSIEGTSNFNSQNLTNVGLINGINIGTLSGSVLPANIIAVAITGGQHTTINSALTASNSGDVVVVYPGTYEETFQIPSGVRVVGYPASQNVIISGSGNGTRVVMSDTSTLRECTVIGPDSGDSPIIDMSGS